MRTQLTTHPEASRTRELTEPVSGRRPGLGLLTRLLWAATLVLPVFGTQAAVVFTTLYSFGSVADTNGVPLDGANPHAGLVQGSDGNLYGTTWYFTGTSGTVFQISTNGVLTNLYSFTGGNDGAYPYAGLVQGSDGYFYGTTQGGGTNGGAGTVFKISTNGALTTLYSFTGTNDGANPMAGLVQDSDGYFYGTTRDGGTNNLGTVFKISTKGVLTTLYSFGSIQDTNGLPLDGADPTAALVQGSDGNFYGTAGGTIFKISTNGALTTLYSFGRNNGLVQGSDGNFYGTTPGIIVAWQWFNLGTVFRLTVVPDPQLTIIPSGLT